MMLYLKKYEGAGILPDGPLDAAIGGSVLFETTKTPPETPFLVVTWSFGANNIGISTPSGENIGVNYTGRARITHSTGSLELSNLTAADSGDYGVAIVPSTGGQEWGTYSCFSFMNVSDASVKPTNPPVEGTSLNLTCEASGSVLSRKWMKDDSDLILTDNMKLHDNNRVLSFTTVSRNDNGEYVCHISNSFSSMLAAFSLTVNYGPENVKISGENQIKVGSTIKLSCTADSEPLAEFTWLFNETQILNSSSELIKDNANISDSGTYTCRATNEITGKSGSAEHRLSVTNTSGDNNYCDTGCIVGIVVACVVVVAVAIGVGCYCVQKK
uniref:Si:dkey-11o1.2 n=1 Tax=Salarias fasciatus TaxID=181472 RepID=A0A672J3U5_SALFA